MRNPRNKKFKDACATVQSILGLARQEKVYLPELEKDLARTIARSTRRVKEQLRQYAAWVDVNFDYVGIESNTGIAIGISSQAYTGATKQLVSALRSRLGTDRVREVDPFYNSQECSRCNHRDKETWSRRLGKEDQTCTCTVCGYSADRDLNSSLNVRSKLILSLAA